MLYSLFDNNIFCDAYLRSVNISVNVTDIDDVHFLDEPDVPRQVLDSINSLAEGNTAIKEDIDAVLK